MARFLLWAGEAADLTGIARLMLRFIILQMDIGQALVPWQPSNMDPAQQCSYPMETSLLQVVEIIRMRIEQILKFITPLQKRGPQQVTRLI